MKKEAAVAAAEAASARSSTIDSSTRAQSTSRGGLAGASQASVGLATDACLTYQASTGLNSTKSTIAGSSSQENEAVHAIGTEDTTPGM